MSGINDMESYIVSLHPAQNVPIIPVDGVKSQFVDVGDFGGDSIVALIVALKEYNEQNFQRYIK